MAPKYDLYCADEMVLSLVKTGRKEKNCEWGKKFHFDMVIFRFLVKKPDILSKRQLKT